MQIHRKLIETINSASRLYPVIVMEGMRDVGKTTVAKQLIDEGVFHEYRSFQNADELEAAKADPKSYIQTLPQKTIIDEAQLVEEITLTIKQIVDEDPSAGTFLLTGSERLSRRNMEGTDPLAGRTSPPFRLRPLTLNEKTGNKNNGIIDRLFAKELGEITPKSLDRSEILSEIMVGGMPRVATNELLATNPEGWYENYLRTVLSLSIYSDKDLRSLESTFRYIAGQTSQIINLTDFGKKSGRDARTVDDYIGRFESTFLLNQLPGWRSELYKSETSRTKLHITDNGLATHLGGLNPEESSEDFGKLFVTFVVNELMSQASCQQPKPKLYHWRDRNRNEIDLLLVSREGIVCVEIKSASQVARKAFNNINFFAKRYPKKFIAGYVFYTGDNLLPFGENLWAVPAGYLQG